MRRFWRPWSNASGWTTFDLDELFQEVDDKGLHVVFLLDEFERVTENVNFGPDFYYGLRSLMIRHKVALVTSSRLELIELCHSEAVKSSPFFNIFANINLRLFSDADWQLHGFPVAQRDGSTVL